MNASDLKVGMTVYWTDPAEIYEPTAEHSSGVWRVVFINGFELDGDRQDTDEDSVISCVNEAGGELECVAGELEPTAELLVFPDKRKPHERMELPTGTQHAEGRIVE